MFRYKLSQLGNDNKISYEEAKVACPPEKAMHLGQLKLFYSELMFLAKYAKDGDKVLYVGAASGYHIGKLAQMFSTLTFDLWDPGRFDIEPQPNITIFNKFFNNPDAEAYKGLPRLLFMCDIRNLAIRKFTKEGNEAGIEDVVTDDMAKQMNWAKIMQPTQSYLKFRLRYDNINMPYLTGTIYFQPYAPVSTECRLLTNNYEDMIEYNAKDFDEKLAWHNADRCASASNPSERWAYVCQKYRIRNIWDNVFAFNTLRLYLESKGLDHDDDSVAKLFVEVIEYHRIKYGNKYTIVYW